MRARVEGAGVELAYQQVGHGPPVLFIHDMADATRSAAALAPLVTGVRLVSYDRRGYGDSGAPEPYEGTSVYEQSEDAAALIGHLRLAPAVVCGAGFGALIALDLALRHAGLVRALVCTEPPLYAFVPQATEVLAAEHEMLRETVREHDPRAAVQRWRSQHASLWALYPSAAEASERTAGAAAGGAASAADDRAGRDAATAGAAKDDHAFFADFAGLSSWPVTRAELRTIAVPIVVLTGPFTPPHLLAAAEALARLGSAARRERDGDVARAIAGLLA